MQAKHILFVDNDSEYLAARSTLIERAGYRVTTINRLDQAEAALRDRWFHLAVLDVRLVDDSDEHDLSGLRLAKQEQHSCIPKIILTKFPETVQEMLDGLSPIMDFVAKHDDSQKLLLSIEKAFTQRVLINLDLVFQPNTANPISFPQLASLIDPSLEGELFLDRTSELQDLFRRIFHNQDHVRIDRIIWQQDGRAAITVLAFRRGARPDAFIVVCGERDAVRQEAHLFDEFAPRATGDTGTTLSKKAETTHFAANAYSLTNNDLEKVQTLGELYRTGPESIIKTTITALFRKTLNEWHRSKPVLNQDVTTSELYRQRLKITSTDILQTGLEQRIKGLETQAPMLEVAIKRSNKTINFAFQGMQFSYPDPLPFLYKTFQQEKPAWLVNVPGNLSGENIIADETGNSWLTDFAGAGLAPLLWNYISLEAAIRFDWIETNDIRHRYALEQRLNNPGSFQPDLRDLDAGVRRPGNAIQTIRKSATHVTSSEDVLAYQRGIFFHATQRLAKYDPASPVTPSELARLIHVLISMSMLVSSFGENAKNVASTVAARRNDELRIANETARIVIIGNSERRLSPQLFALFKYLYQNAGKICPKGELVKNVLPGGYDETYLPTLIGRIRKVIEDDPDEPRYLITVPNTGYQLIIDPQ